MVKNSVLRHGRLWLRIPPMVVDMFVSTWWVAWLPCLLPRGQEARDGSTVALKPTTGIRPCFETQGRYHLKSKIGVSVAPHKNVCDQRGFMSLDLSFSDIFSESFLLFGVSPTFYLKILSNLTPKNAILDRKNFLTSLCSA